MSTKPASQVTWIRVLKAAVIATAVYYAIAICIGPNDSEERARQAPVAPAQQAATQAAVGASGSIVESVMHTADPKPGGRAPTVEPSLLSRLKPCDPKTAAAELAKTQEASSSLGKSRVFERIRDAQAASTDISVRAMSLLLSSMDGGIDTGKCEGKDCTAELAQRDAAALHAATQLAMLARESRQPAVHVWALQACRASQADPIAVPACGSLSLQQWADAAPDNVWSWLALAHEADKKQDTSGLESAMHRAASAGDWTHPNDTLLRLLLTSLPQDSTTADALEAKARVVGRLHGHAGKLSSLSTLSNYCDANQDANKQQTCKRLAEAMLDNTKDLLDLSIVASVGERSGINTARIDHAKLRKRGAEEALRATASKPLRPLESAAKAACRFIDHQARFAVRAVEVGEIEAALELRR